jgi:hypothetical protein
MDRPNKKTKQTVTGFGLLTADDHHHILKAIDHHLVDVENDLGRPICRDVVSVVKSDTTCVVRLREDVLEVSATETRIVGTRDVVYNVVNSKSHGIFTEPSLFMKNDDYIVRKSLGGPSYIRFPNHLLYKPIVYALRLEQYPVDLHNQTNLFGLLKMTTDDGDVAQKIQYALEFLTVCNSQQDNKYRVETVHKSRAKQMKRCFRDHNTYLMRNRRSYDYGRLVILKRCPDIQYDDWTSKCELCHHRAVDPTFETRRLSAVVMLTQAKTFKFTNASVVLRVYRRLVDDFTNADHSLANRDDLLDRYIRAMIDARRLLRVKSVVYEHFRPIGTLKKLVDSINIDGMNDAIRLSARKRLKIHWTESIAETGVTFENGCLDKQLLFHPVDRLCTDFIDSHYEQVGLEDDYDDLQGFTAIDKHVIYAAFGAVILGKSQWKIAFEGTYQLECAAAEKKLFERLYAQIKGIDMVIPAITCAIQFSRAKAIQSYVLMQTYGTWIELCQQGPSKIYERLVCRPDLVGAFIASEITCRMSRGESGLLDVSKFHVVKSGAYTVSDNGYGLKIGRGNPAGYKNVSAMTLLEFVEEYEKWCSTSEERRPYRDYFRQPLIGPICAELAKHNIVCVNGHIDCGTAGQWKDAIKRTDYIFKNYVFLGCCPNKSR